MTEKPTSQQQVSDLISWGYTPDQIAAMLDQRVSSRTIYRWHRGGSEPQNEADMNALGALHSSLRPAEKDSSAA